MDDEPSKPQEEACGARPQGPHAPVANVVGSLIEVASCNEIFRDAPRTSLPVRRVASSLIVHALNASGLRGTDVLGSHLLLCHLHGRLRPVNTAIPSSRRTGRHRHAHVARRTGRPRLFSRLSPPAPATITARNTDQCKDVSVLHVLY